MNDKKKIAIDAETAGEFLIGATSVAGKYLVLNRTEEAIGATIQIDGDESVDIEARTNALVIHTQSLEVKIINVENVPALNTQLMDLITNND